MKLIIPIFKILKNKFVIATVAFAVWMLFFDQNDWGLIRSMTNKYNDLEKSKKGLMVQIQDTKKELSLLNSNAASVEKYARENFYMKKDNEDLFVVKKPD